MFTSDPTTFLDKNKANRNTVLKIGHAVQFWGLIHTINQQSYCISW